MGTKVVVVTGAPGIPRDAGGGGGGSRWIQGWVRAWAQIRRKGQIEGMGQGWEEGRRSEGQQ